MNETAYPTAARNGQPYQTVQSQPSWVGRPQSAPAILVAQDLVMDYSADLARAQRGHAPAGTMPAAMHPLALDHVSLQLHEGESVAVMGPSGSGKSTLLHALAGIITPTSGTVSYRGVNLGALPDEERTKLRRSAFGFVFQSGQLLPELPAIENIALPMMLDGVGYRQAIDTAMLWLERLGLRALAAQRPGEMSGGQMQRIAIARALAVKPAVVFADEPTGALDQATGREVMSILMQTARDNGSAVVVVTHDSNVAAFCSRTVTMRDGMLLAAPQGQWSARPTAVPPVQTIQNAAEVPQGRQIPQAAAVPSNRPAPQMQTVHPPQPITEPADNSNDFTAHPADPGRGWIGGER